MSHGEPVTIRRLEDRDLPFLRQMLHTAVFWRPWPPSLSRRLRRLGEDVLRRVVLRRYIGLYHRHWGRRGDTGFVAERAGQPVGAVWYRLFTVASHGDGFVDESTPELVIAVKAPARGRGIGRLLLDRIAKQAREDGIERLALSVNQDNPARRLYLDCGYRDYSPGDGLERMVLEL